MTDTPTPSMLLEPETINFPDGHPFLVRTEKSETIYYPYDTDKEKSFIRQVSFLKDGQYNLEILTFGHDSAQPNYSRILAKGSQTHGVWSNHKPKTKNLKFVYQDSILSEYDGRKMARQSVLNPVDNGVIQMHHWDNLNYFFPVIYTENPDHTGLRTSYHDPKKTGYMIHKMPKRNEEETFYGVPHGISRSYSTGSDNPYTVSHYRLGQRIITHSYGHSHEKGNNKFLPQFAAGNVLVQYDEDDNKAYCYISLGKQSVGSKSIRDIADLTSGDIIQRNPREQTADNVYDAEGEYDPSSKFYPSFDILEPLSIKPGSNIKRFLETGRMLKTLGELPMDSAHYKALRTAYMANLDKLIPPDKNTPGYQLD